MPYCDSLVTKQPMRQWLMKRWRVVLVTLAVIAGLWIVLEIAFYLLVTEPIDRYYFPRP
jgi:hypothetical protein